MNPLLKSGSSDLTGLTFGKLKCVRFLGYSIYHRRSATWGVVCECGTTLTVRASKLLDGSKTACSKACIYEDITGRTIGTYRVIGRAPRQGDRWGNFWNCKCLMCGTEVVFPSRSINCQQGCKACQKKPNAHSAFHSVMIRYTASAKRRGLIFDLTPEECRNLFEQDCRYCGIPPTQESRVNSSLFLYNGIDRIDPTLGYIKGNVCSCCKHCNLRKGKMDLSEFREWINKVHSRINVADLPLWSGMVEENYKP